MACEYDTPTLALAKGDVAVIVSGKGAVAMVKVIELEVPPPGAALNTRTSAAPAVAMSLAVIAAASSVLLTKVVGRFDPFHLTIESLTKFEPLTERVKAGPPASAELGLREVTPGTGLLILTVKSLVDLVSDPSMT
jgi:hypothetical protein